MPPRKADAGLKRARHLGPGEQVEAMFAHRLFQRGADGGGFGAAVRPARKRESAQPATAFGRDRACARLLSGASFGPASDGEKPTHPPRVEGCRGTETAS